MNERLLDLTLNDKQFSRFGFVSCGILFLGGSVAGAVTAGFINSSTSLTENFSNFLSLFLTGTNSKPDFFEAAIDVFKYNLIAIALGFSILGVFFIPLLTAVRGFFLTFSVSTVVRVIGGKGALLALSIFGVDTLIGIPCFIILSVYSYSVSSYLLRLAVSKNQRSGISPFNSSLFTNSGICLAVLLVAAAFDCYVAPRLISLAASHI